MRPNALITIYIQVYNVKPYIRRCIDSVLNQTYSNFELFIFDNGCTDGCEAILRSYAQHDARIHLTRIEKNDTSHWHYLDIMNQVNGDYFAVLDSDDWWDNDYLERLLSFAEKNNLDIACTGTAFHDKGDEISSKRSINQQFIINKSQFGLYYPNYHAFFRTYWGKLVKMKLARTDPFQGRHISYGRDTICCFYWLRKAAVIGIDASVLYHYRVHLQSSSYQYNSSRFDADIILYQDALDFLKPYGPLSSRNREFIHLVYANAIADTAWVIHNSNLSPEEKLHEYATIVQHPVTQRAYHYQETSCENSRTQLLHASLAAAQQGAYQEKDLQIAAQGLLPHCGVAVTRETFPILMDDRLRPSFLQDDADALVQKLVSLSLHNTGFSHKKLGLILQRLSVNHKLLCQLSDMDFISHYGQIYMLLWHEENEQALDQMTGLLLENQVKYAFASFLGLYINLAAMQDQQQAFLFGKIQLAAHYCATQQWDMAAAALKELDEFGLGHEEDVVCLKRQLSNNQP